MSDKVKQDKIQELARKIELIGGTWRTGQFESLLRSELEPLFEFCSHGYACAHWHAWNPRNKKCDCGLSGWSKKFK